MAKELLVFGEKTFKITVPDDAKITFGPFSPPTADRQDWRESGRAIGTLRIYRKTKDNIVAVFSGVKGFRDLSLDYEEEVAREEGAIIWKSDKDGYKREEKMRRHQEWKDPAQLDSGSEAGEEVVELDDEHPF